MHGDSVSLIYHRIDIGVIMNLLTIVFTRRFPQKVLEREAAVF